MVETFDDGEIVDKSELEEYHIFHDTHRDSVQSILSTGFEPKFDRSKENDERYLEAVVDRLGLDPPVDRVNSSFLYPSFELATSHSTYGYIIIVDARKLSYPIYMAEVTLYDAIFDEAPHMGSVNELSEDQLGLGQEYLDSITVIQSVRSISSTASRYSVPELIVDSDISSDAVVGYIRV